MNTESLLIINFHLSDVAAGGDPAVMVHHYLQAYFPSARDQVLQYEEVSFSFDPASSPSVETQKRKINKVVNNVVK